jgi:hypothetical protein
LLLVLLLPIPIKTSVFYSEKKLGIYFYNFKLTQKKHKKKTAVVKVSPPKKKIISIFKLGINVLRHNRFKPYIKLNINFMYGLEDAAKTAEVYGLLNLMNPVIYKGLDEFFIVKNFVYNIHADFNKTLLKFNMISIIFINLLTIIYIIAVFSTKYIIGKKFPQFNN